jgi:hypothetical protein
MNDAENIDGTAVEMVPYAPPPPTTLFHTDDPVEVIAKASRVADALKGVIVQQKLAKSISGRDHVLVEGWTTLGSMLGVVPVVVWSRRIEPPTEYVVHVTDYEWVAVPGGRKREKREKAKRTYTVEGYDWEARVEARTLDGRVIGGAEAMCSRKEDVWAKRDDYALRSMAQTRAASKALRGPLGFVVTLAGFAATPAEEMGEPMGNGRVDPPAPVVYQPLIPEKRELVLGAIQDAGQNLALVLAAVGLEKAEDMTAEHAGAIRTILDRVGAKS